VNCRARFAALVCLIALPLASAAAQEEDKTFPSRPIHIVVPFPAGGPSDLVSRLIGQKMSEAWNQPVIIDNRPGANTIIGAVAVARAAPDGYTLLMAIDSTLTMNQYLYRTRWGICFTRPPASTSSTCRSRARPRPRRACSPAASISFMRRP
jgi:tripartite-type tricarboxylate transporter receptor subunit TctC